MTAPALQTLTVAVEDRVATVALNRAERANALNDTLWRELEQAFRWCDEEPAVRVVILAAEGRHFCSGIDLDMFAQLAAQQQQLEPARGAEFLRREILTLQSRLTAIERCRKPVLAAVHATCIGAGVDMISCCDMRYCTEDAWFSIREIDIGMTADVGTLQRLPRLIGDGLVRELAYTGRRVDAAEAQAAGLVNRVYANKQALLEGVTALARDIAGKSPLAIRGTKEMLLYTRDHPVADALNYVATWNAGMLSQDDVLRSITAAAGQAAQYDD